MAQFKVNIEGCAISGSHFKRISTTTGMLNDAESVIRIIEKLTTDQDRQWGSWTITITSDAQTIEYLKNNIVIPIKFSRVEFVGLLDVQKIRDLYGL